MKNFRGIKTILFDCDETLWLHRKDEDKILAKALGIPLTKEFTNQYCKMLQKCYTYFETQMVTIEKFTRLVYNSMPILAQNGICAKKFVEVWFATETTFINEDALEILHFLKAHKYKIVILTDTFYDKQVNLLDKYGIMPYIDDIYACDDWYLKKNSKSIFRVVLPGQEEKYVIVGNSLENDIAFAMNAGIRSIWYNPESKKNDTKFKPTAEVQSLLELRYILK